MANTSELDKDLVNGLKAAKSKRACFALVLKGSSDGALIVSKAKVPPAQIAAAKKESGGSAVLKGFCLYEDGKYVFETAKEAPATAAQAVKVIAKRDAGMAVHAEFRVSTDPELLADDGDATAATPPTAAPESRAAVPPPPPPPPQGGAEVVNRLNALTADIKLALAGPNQARVKSLFVAVNGQIKNKDFAQADKGLDELDALVKQGQAAAPAQAPPPQNGAEVINRLNALTADIKLALAGANQARVKSLFVAVSGQIKNKDFAQASKGLDELDALVKQGQAAAPAQAPPPPTGAEVINRLNALTADIKLALAGPNQARVKSLFVAVNGQIKNKDFAQASKGLDELEGLLNGAPGTHESPASAAKAPALSAALAQWTTERGKVIKDLQMLEGHITGMDHPDGNAAIILVKAIRANLSARPETAQSVAELERYITTDEIISEAEGPNGFGIKIDIRSGLLPALAAIRAALAA